MRGAIAGLVLLALAPGCGLGPSLVTGSESASWQHVREEPVPGLDRGTLERAYRGGENVFVIWADSAVGGGGGCSGSSRGAVYTGTILTAGGPPVTYRCATT